MEFASAFDSVVKAGIPAAAGRFGSALNVEWVDEALEQTGTMSVRRRRLPARLVVWLVISMALFRDCAIRTVATHLGLSNPWGSARRGVRARSVAASAVAKGRQRLGDKAMQIIFERSAEAWTEASADADRWQGLSLWGVDGTTLNVPDTVENEEAFGLPGTSRGRPGYPQVRLVALMALRSHLLRGASFGPYRGKETGEQALYEALRPMLPDDSLTVFDKGFLNYGALWRQHHDADGVPTTRHFLIRAKTNLKCKTLAVLGAGDELAEVSMSPQARKKDPRLPRKMRVRVVSYQVDGWPQRKLLTSLLDPKRFPARQVAAMYHERWETEVSQPWHPYKLKLDPSSSSVIRRCCDQVRFFVRSARRRSNSSASARTSHGRREISSSRRASNSPRRSHEYSVTPGMPSSWASSARHHSLAWRSASTSGAM